MTNSRLKSLAWASLGALVGGVAVLFVSRAVGFYLPPAAWSWDTTVALVGALATIVIAIIAAVFSQKRNRAEREAAEREAARSAMTAAVKFRVRSRAENPGVHRWSTFTVSALNLQEVPTYDVELWVAGMQYGETGKALFEDARPFEWQGVPLGKTFRRREEAGNYLRTTVLETVEVRYSVLGRRFTRRLGDTKQIEVLP